MDPVPLRVAWAAFAFLSASGAILLYVALMFIIPPEDELLAQEPPINT